MKIEIERDELLDLATRVDRLHVYLRSDPERFHLEKSEAARGLRRLAGPPSGARLHSTTWRPPANVTRT